MKETEQLINPYQEIIHTHARFQISKSFTKPNIYRSRYKSGDYIVSHPIRNASLAQLDAFYRGISEILNITGQMSSEDELS